jgi:hypothetical protein
LAKLKKETDKMDEKINGGIEAENSKGVLPIGTSAGLGVPLGEEKDPNKLREMAEKLWSLLDDIDTMDDVAKERDVYYRNCVREIQRKRFEILTSDGYGLFLPKEKHPAVMLPLV